MGAMVARERFHRVESGSQQIDRLRVYLADWQEWERRFKMDLGAPNSVPWARFMKNDKPSGDNEASGQATINEPAMLIVDASVEELRDKEPEKAIAIRWRYLNINVGAFVLRFRRLEGLNMMQLDALADQAELTLLPIAKRRGLIL